MITTLPTRCPVFGDEVPVRNDDTVLSLTPRPHLSWICPNCGDLHLWSLTPDRYDWLVARHYDIAAAINGEELYVAEPVRP